MYNYSLFSKIAGSGHVVHSRTNQPRIYSTNQQCYLRGGVSGEDLPLIGEVEIISIPPSIKFSCSGPICLWLHSLTLKRLIPTDIPSLQE